MTIRFTGKQAQVKSVVRQGELLFTHFGLSGPLILNCAHEVKQLLDHGPVTATIDLLPEDTFPVVDKRVLETFSQHPNKCLRVLSWGTWYRYPHRDTGSLLVP